MSRGARLSLAEVLLRQEEAREQARRWAAREALRMLYAAERARLREGAPGPAPA